MSRPKTIQPEGSKFEKVVSRILGYSVRESISIEWVTGGVTGGSCWGHEANTPVSGEPEPDFKELDKLLLGLCPNLSFLMYKNLISEVVYQDTRSDWEYYGNSTNYGTKTVKLADLEKFLLEHELWNDEE